MTKADPRYLCPRCDGELIFSHKDDVETRWFKCAKCGEQTSKPKKTQNNPNQRNLPSIEFTELKDGAQGITIDEENLFLAVKRKGKLWKFRLIDIFGGWNPVTAWISLLDPERLRSTIAAKPLRQLLKNNYNSNAPQVLENIIGLIQDNAEELQIKKLKQPPSDENADFNENIVEKAWNLLRDPAFFYKLGKVFEQGFLVPRINKPRFIIGEERNKRLLGPLLIGASKLNMTSIIKLLGDPGTVKDTMLRMWLKLLPIKSIERSYITAASLRYSEEMKNAELIYIPDSPELRGEMGRHMRFMRADDGGLISEYATRNNETGEMTTKIARLPVKGVATTSNAITGDTALESGMWTLRTNGSDTLTRQVKEAKLKFRAGNRRLFPQQELEGWKCAFNLLLNNDLPQHLPKIPFAESLIPLLESERSESRRDPDKFCDLISLIAWIRRFQKSSDSRDEADILDLYFALQIGLDAITQTISELNEREQRIFMAVKKAGMTEVTCKYVANETRISYKTCYRYLEKLIEKGFLLKDKERGRNVYSVFSEKTPKELIITQGRNFEKPELLMKFILNSLQGFSLSHQDTDTTSFIDPITGEKVNVTIGEDEEAVITVENTTHPYPYEKVRSSERNKETPLVTEKEPKQLLPSGMIRDTKAKIETKAHSDTIQSATMFHVKSWGQTYRNERGEISLLDLADYIRKELKQNSQRVIKLAFDQAILMPSPKPGKAVVV